MVFLRFLMVVLLINNIPFTDMLGNGFRPNFGGSYFPDEVHYFELADSFAKFSPVANVANIGYPLFLAPIIYFTGASGPEDISKIVFIILSGDQLGCNDLMRAAVPATKGVEKDVPRQSPPKALLYP